MVWRQPYETRILRHAACPATPVMNLEGEAQQLPEVCIASFGFSAINDQNLWWKLFQSDFPNDPKVRRVFIFDTVAVEDIKMASSFIPPSESYRCFVIEDPYRVWADLVQPEKEHHAFAAIIENGIIPLMMVGPPTEDAWEEFSREWRLRI